MTPHEEGSTDESAPAKRAQPRRSRRGGRGRRRQPSRSTHETADPSVEPAVEARNPESALENIAGREQSEEKHQDPPAIEEQRDDRRDDFVEERELPAERQPRRDFRPAPPAAIAEAIEEVNQIMASLKQVLEQMEEVLETLELAEVQKTADEREIQSLRQGLRQIDRRGPAPKPELTTRREQEGSDPRGPEPRRRDDRRHRGD
jgi:hypothetical protein